MAVIWADAPLIGLLKLRDVAGSGGDPQSADPVLVDDTPGGEFVDQAQVNRQSVEMYICQLCLNCILLFLGN